jgi:hypothetical protein
VRATIDDLLGLFTLLDVHKVELPCYVIMDIRRVPSLDSKVDVDLSVLAAFTTLVNDLRQQVSALADKVDMLTSCASNPVMDSYTVPLVNTSTSEDSQGTRRNNTSSWAVRTAPVGSHPSVYKAAEPPLRPPARPVKFGTRSGLLSDKVKSAPRFLTCFVGRLIKETTVEDLCGYLKEVGIKEVQCRKLDDKDGAFRTAAFRVSCPVIYKDLFHDESNWPDGALLRDWVYRRQDV